MKNIWAIAEKELKAYFMTPLAYVITSIFISISGFIFYGLLSRFNLLSAKYARYPGALAGFSINSQIVQPLLFNMGFILIFFIPAITMRIFSEEKKTGTIELLFTSPITIFEIVLGKFLGCFILYTLMLGISSLFMIPLMIFGKLEIWPVVSGYTGLLFLGMTVIAIGMWASSLTMNQIIALIVGFGILLFLYVLVKWPAYFVNKDLAGVLNYLSLDGHLFDFTQGMIDTKHIIFYISGFLAGIFLTYQTVSSMQWKG